MLILFLIYIICAGYALVMWNISNACQKFNYTHKTVVTTMLGGSILFGIPEILFISKLVSNVIQKGSIEAYFGVVAVCVISIVITAVGMKLYSDKAKKVIVLGISLLCITLGCVYGFYGA